MDGLSKGSTEGVRLVRTEEQTPSAYEPDLHRVQAADIVQPSAGGEMDPPSVQPGRARSDSAGDSVERDAATEESDPEPESEMIVGDLHGQPSEKKNADHGGAENHREQDDAARHCDDGSRDEGAERERGDKNSSDLRMSIELSHGSAADPRRVGFARECVQDRFV